MGIARRGTSAAVPEVHKPYGPAELVVKIANQHALDKNHFVKDNVNGKGVYNKKMPWNKQDHTPTETK